MAKKIFGGLLIFTAICTLIGAIANETIGSILPVIVFVCSGIFLLTFDNVKKFSYIDGIKKRKTQCTIITVFLIIYLVMLVLASIGIFASLELGLSFPQLTGAWLIAALPYIIPLGFFGGMVGMYVTPYSACCKNFNYDANINQYFAPNDVFVPYSSDNSILANRKVLFFPNLLCAIPFDQIASTKLVNAGIEKDVYFTLTNGKKISVATKKYDEIQNAINYNKKINMNNI